MVAYDLVKKWGMYAAVCFATVLLVVLSARPVAAALLPTAIVSLTNTSAATDGDSVGGVGMGAGTSVIFQSDAANIVPGDTNGVTDMFIRNTITGQTTRISTDSSGNQSNSDIYNYADSTPDGRYVIFDSEASNLVPSDTNNARDIFLKDLQSNTVTRVSTDSSGAQGNGGGTGSARISSNGRYVLFDSSASNLVAGDTNNVRDMFLKDLQTNVTTRVSTDSSGAQGNGAASGWEVMTPDARYIVFRSTANNLVTGDTNGFSDIFVKDLQTNVTTRVSTDSSGAQGNASVNGFLGISADGRYIAFSSTASNFVSGDTNAASDMFLKDLQTNVTTRVSTDSSGAQLNGASGVNSPVLSSDGKYLVFDSSATNVVSGADTNAISDLFVKNLASGEVIKLTTSANGGESDGSGVQFPSTMSSSGRYIYFSTDATNMINNDTNGFIDVFMRQNPFWVEPASTVTSNQASVIAPGVPSTGQAAWNTTYPKVLIVAGMAMVAGSGIALYRLRADKTTRRA